MSSACSALHSIPMEDRLILDSIAWQLPAGDKSYVELPSANSAMSTKLDIRLENYCREVQDHEESLSVLRPFSALKLPEWIHEKAAEDDALGVFRCCSVASFREWEANTDSGSMASSVASSPAVSPDVIMKKPQRQGMSWADLQESEEDERFALWTKSTCLEDLDSTSDDEGTVASTVSTAASSPVSSLVLEMENVKLKPRRRTGVNWAELDDSAEDDRFASWKATMCIGQLVIPEDQDAVSSNVSTAAPSPDQTSLVFKNINQCSIGSSDVRGPATD